MPSFVGVTASFNGLMVYTVSVTLPIFPPTESKVISAEYTFYLAIPAMAGASLLKFLKFGFGYTSMEWVILIVRTMVAFVVSIFVIKFLMNYIKKHDFKVFGWYRIALGIFVLALSIFKVIG